MKTYAFCQGKCAFCGAGQNLFLYFFPHRKREKEREKDYESKVLNLILCILFVKDFFLNKKEKKLILS